MKIHKKLEAKADLAEGGTVRSGDKNYSVVNTLSKSIYSGK